MSRCHLDPGSRVRRSKRRVARHRLASLAALVLLAGPAASQLQTQQEPPVALEGPAIALEDAVAETLRNSYRLALASEQLEERRGVVAEQAGLFDSVFFIDSSFQMRETDLLRQQLNNEIKRRVPLEFATELLGQAADEIQGQIPTDASLIFDRCTDFQTRLIFELQDGTSVTLCTNNEGGVEAIELPAGSVFSSSDDVVTLLRVQRILDIIGLDLDGTADDLIEAFADEIRRITLQLRLMSDLFRIQRARLGDLPDVEQFLELSAEVGQQFRFRSGVGLTASLSMLGREDNYEDKDLNPALGDTLAPNSFTTTAGLALDIPLGLGRGRIATAGPEMAAQAAARAQEQIYLHTASQEVLETVNAYWGLASAQAELEVLSRSEAIQSQILEGTRRLVEADELAAAEVNRTEASYAQVVAQVATVRQQVVEARMALAEAMGVSTNRLVEAPVAAEPLPDLEGLDAADLDPAPWVGRALQQRRDLAAAALATEATEILARSARANLRRRVDLSFNVSYTGFEEGFSNRVYELDGYLEAARGGIAGPSYGIFLRWELPFQNRVAKGRLAQAAASASQSRINEVDLERTIRLRVHDLVGAIQQRRRHLEQLEETLAQQERALQSSLELFDIGDLTLIDLLTTESQVTVARRDVLRLQAELAILEAQLRFETGTLLTDPQGDELDPAALRLALPEQPRS